MFVWWGFTSLSTPYWVISWRSVLLAEETGVPGGNRRPAAGNWQTLSHMAWKSNLNFANARPRLELTPRGDRLVIDTGKLWRTTIRSRPPRPLVSIEREKVYLTFDNILSQFIIGVNIWMTIFEKKMKILLYTPVFQIRIFSFRGSNNIFFFICIKNY